MSKAPELKRRHFLLLAFAMAGALAVRSKLPEGVAGWQENVLAPKLAALFTHQDSARAIGRAYLQSYPGEANALVLQDNIMRGIAGGDAALVRASVPEMSVLINDRIRQDFAAEQVVKVDGWILSITEARLCALAALA